MTFHPRIDAFETPPAAPVRAGTDEALIACIAAGASTLRADAATNPVAGNSAADAVAHPSPLDQQLRRVLHRAGFSGRIEAYTWDRAAAETLSIYREVLGERDS